MKRLYPLVFFFLFSGPAFADHGLTQQRLEQIVKAMATSAKGEQGVVEFEYNQIAMYLISDVEHNRMRIVAPIANYPDLTRAQLDAILESNYHKALDARYAVSRNVLYAAFIHSLEELHDGQIRSAVRQVANLAQSFGTEYSSGELTFAGQ